MTRSNRSERCRLQKVEDIGALGPDPLADAVQPGGAAGQLQCGPGAVHQHGFARAGERRPDAEAAQIGVEVQHPRAFRKPRREGPVVALVVEPAGLLSAERIAEEAAAVLDEIDRPGDLAEDEPVLRLQTLQAALGAVIAKHERVRLQHVPQGFDQRRFQPRYARTVELRHRHAGEEIDDEAGQAVGFGVGNPAPGRQTSSRLP